MSPRSKNGSRGAIVNNTTGVQSIGNEKRSQHDESGFGDSAPISRRGLLAALAIAAGLGIMRKTRAYALAAQNFGRGEWIGNKWENGHISGAITHPHPQRGVNDYFWLC